MSKDDVPIPRNFYGPDGTPKKDELEFTHCPYCGHWDIEDLGDGNWLCHVCFMDWEE